MHLSRRSVAAAVAATCLAIAACHRDDAATGPATVDSAALQRAQDALSQPAWLRSHLPSTTVAYLRIPSPWGLIGAVPDGRSLDQVTAGNANLATIAALREAIAKDKVLADSGAAAYVIPLLVDLRSPLEAVASDPIGVMSPGTQVLLSMRLAQHTGAEVAARFAALGPAMTLARPFDANGDSQLAMGAPLHFDAPSQRLFLLVGKQAVDNAQLSALLAGIAKTQTDTPVAQAIATQEHAIDESGEGLFGWASLHGVGSLATGAIPPTVGTLPGDLLSKADGVAFGAGSVDGHGHMQLRFHAPQSRLLGYLAPQQFDPSFDTAGAPRWVANIALPGAAQWQAFENNLALDFGAERAASWREAMAKWKATTGFDIAQIVQWVGPELISFEDDAGSYTALRVRDRKALYAQIERLAKQHQWRFTERSLDGITIHSLTVHGSGSSEDVAKKAAPGMTAMTELASRIGTHFYWVEDGDFLIFAKVPQALADRAAAHPSQALDSWLKARGYEGADSLLGVTAVTRDAQRSTYYAYLQLLQIINDLSGGSVDLMAMPAAHTLKLPHQGVAGLSLGVTKDGIAFRVNYEQQPLELIGASGNGSGMTAVAVVAIMAAIAIPAYQDYVIRAQVAEGLTLADTAKTAVAEYRAQRGRWPAGNAAAGLPLPAALHGKYVDSVSVGEQGTITVHFGSEPPSKADTRIAGKTLQLTPELDNQAIRWSCRSDEIPAKNLPASCRQP
ncbi:pilin [Dyella ginsengisoli]